MEVVMADIDQITRRVEALRRDAIERDQRHQTVYDARAQKIDNIAPGSMPDAWPRPITANVLDTSARQLAENLAPLPSLNCAPGRGDERASEEDGGEAHEGRVLVHHRLWPEAADADGL
jgi:hypothetical protein